MKIKVNGEEKNFEEPLFISTLLEQFKLNPKLIVAEVNSEIISREKFETFSLKEDDRVELIRFMGGG